MQLLREIVNLNLLILNISYKLNDIVHSLFFQQEGTPFQSNASENSEAFIEIYPEFDEGSRDLSNRYNDTTKRNR